VDHLAAPALEQAVESILSADATRLLLDLSDCPYLDSGGLSVLLCAVREVRGGGSIGVIAPSPNLLRLFEITGLNVFPDFRVFASSDEVMATLEG
jgi:anti-sigma B factor antagonist